MTIKVFSTFSGYGGWEFGLQDQNIEYELVGYSEIDKYAIQCFDQNHKAMNYGDITKLSYENIKNLPDFDLFVSSPPCQAFSVAGKGEGKDDSKGRGKLFEDAIDIMSIKQPKFAVYENVKGLTFKKHKEYFDRIVYLMKCAGYNVFYKILNTKDLGIPQNRERIFFVCIRKDIDPSYFQFPQERELTLKLKDLLEPNVDNKYYLKPEQVERLLSKDSTSFRTRNLIKKNYVGSLQSAMSHGNTIPCITEPSAYDCYNKKVKNDGTTPSLTLPHHNSLRLLQIRTATKKGYDEAKPYDFVNLEQPNSKTRRARVNSVVCNALNCCDLKGVVTEELTIRKLTPKECFRLQGFLRDQINLEGLSDTQKYKLAGNGVSINVVGLLLKEVLKNGIK